MQSQFQDCLPFAQKQIDEGFKYLGFVLKPNDYVFRDWLWLFIKIQKRISFWAHWWLSKGWKTGFIEGNLM
jgi:hypothetical protein